MKVYNLIALSLVCVLTRAEPVKAPRKLLLGSLLRPYGYGIGYGYGRLHRYGDGYYDQSIPESITDEFTGTKNSVPPMKTNIPEGCISFFDGCNICSPDGTCSTDTCNEPKEVKCLEWTDSYKNTIGTIKDKSIPAKIDSLYLRSEKLRKGIKDKLMEKVDSVDTSGDEMKEEMKKKLKATIGSLYTSVGEIKEKVKDKLKEKINHLMQSAPENKEELKEKLTEFHEKMKQYNKEMLSGYFENEEKEDDEKDEKDEDDRRLSTTNKLSRTLRGRGAGVAVGGAGVRRSSTTAAAGGVARGRGAGVAAGGAGVRRSSTTAAAGGVARGRGAGVAAGGAGVRRSSTTAAAGGVRRPRIARVRHVPH